MLLVGKNSDVRAFLDDMKGNGETIKEVAEKFHNNPVLVNMVQGLYNVEVIPKHSNIFLSVVKQLVN